VHSLGKDPADALQEIFPDVSCADDEANLQYATPAMRDVPDMGVPPAPTAPDSQAAPGNAVSFN
jgi:hypothetical protein